MPKEMEFNTPNSVSMTNGQLLDFLLTLKGANPKLMNQIIYYKYDGEFYSFKGCYVEDSLTVLVDLNE